MLVLRKICVDVCVCVCMCMRNWNAEMESENVNEDVGRRDETIYVQSK